MGKNNIFSKILLPIVIAVLAIPLSLIWQYKTPIKHFLPSLLLFTNQRERLIALWRQTSEVDYAVDYEPSHLPVIEGDKFSYEALRRATQNWRYPAVVRGFFSNTTAVQHWTDPDYLPSKIGKYTISLVQNAVLGKVQNNRTNVAFENAFEEIISNKDSKNYLFFPVRTQFHLLDDVGKAQYELLERDVNNLVREDLNLDRLWRGFGDKATHPSFYGSQLIIGQGSADEKTTGTWWHCAAGNNWFVQVAGVKRWYFIDHEHTHMLHPIRGGQALFFTSIKREENEAHFNHVPRRYVDLYPGDLLYNPDFEWHMIENKGGLAIGVPIREVNFTLTAHNNLLFTSVMTANLIASKFGIDIGGYPPVPKK